MLRIKPYTADEWKLIERKGFVRFYGGFIFGSMIVFFLVFGVLDFLVNYDHQSELVRVGVLTALVFAPTAGLAMWFAMKSRFRNSERAG